MWFDVWLFCYVCYCIWLISRRLPIEATMWYYLTKDWQKIARFFGTLAVEAEAAYYVAIKRVSLA